MADAEAAERYGSALIANLLSALRLAFGQPVAAGKLTISWWQATAFAILGLLPPLIYDFAANGTAGEVAWDNLPDALFHLPIFLLAAVAAAYALRRGERALWIFQILLMIALIVDLAYYSLYSLPLGWRARAWLRAAGAYPFIFSLIWLVGATAKATFERLSAPLPRRLGAGVALALLVIYPLTEIGGERALWLPPPSAEEQEAEEPAPAARLDEDILYRQRERLERELGALAPGRPGIIDVYFIGVAGYGGQAVFMKEAKAVGALFRQRFGAAGRTVLLINNRENPRAAPLASVTSLRAALARVAAVMNKDEDILFLFLTSHGAEDHRFVLDFEPVKFHDLEPARLRRLLDESGIKNRVAVVSACYSGGFVDALKNDDTLVISASAADRNSFGCSNETDWTYFGKAYFDEALRKTFSFTKAFELARPAIAERERAEGFTPSEPQMALGRAIETKLARLEHQLEAGTQGAR